MAAFVPAEANQLVHPVDAAARQNRDLVHGRALSPNSAGDQRPVADPLGANIAHGSSLANTSRIEYGHIVDAIAGARAYRVQPESGGPTFLCGLLTRTSSSPLAVYDASTLVPGTAVRFIRHKQQPGEGMIVGCDPTYGYDPRLAFCDCISMGSNTGIQIEAGLQEPFNVGGSIDGNDTNGGIINYGGRTPIDSVEIGDRHFTSILGLATHVDPFMTYMRGNEYTGVWVFYWDGWLRIAGENFEEWAGPTTREVLDDEGETFGYRGVGVYPWEHGGQLLEPTDVTSAVSAADVQGNYAYYGGIEPDDEDLQPFHRFREYTGYVGQGQRKMVVAPDIYSGETIQLYGDTYYQPVGLHEQFITMCGHYGMRSALGWTLAKRPIIPVPKRCRTADSKQGDTSANYKASSHFGSGAEHKVHSTPTPAVTGADEQAVYSCACVMDLHAHLFNWESPHPFHYHDLDYYFPEESEYNHVDSNQEVPEWSDLDSLSYWQLRLPNADTLTIDHRTGQTAKIYRNSAYFTVLDEGGICIGDGFGAEIRLAGGSIWLTAPGDVFIEAGRNAITWGGRDVCLRAAYSVDVTANKRDVKIKAEQNLHMLGANGGGPYGVFIECRSNGDQSYGYPIYDFASSCGEQVNCTGIVLKAKNTEIIEWGKSIYLRTRELTGKATGSSTLTEPVKPGDIVLDTLGQADVITRSKYVKHFVECAIAHIWPDEAGDAVNYFTTDGATLCGDVFVDGDFLNYGSHLSKGNILSADGHVFTKSGGFIAKLAASAVSDLTSALERGHTFEDELVTWSETCFATDMTGMWYAAGRPGNATIIQSAWFSLRVPANYRADQFYHYEPRWQQMARLNSDGLPIWTENPVETNHSGTADWDTTYPFPGLHNLITNPRFKQQDLKLYDTADGRSEDRGALYEAPCTLESVTVRTLNTNYRHIGRDETWS